MKARRLKIVLVPVTLAALVCGCGHGSTLDPSSGSSHSRDIPTNVTASDTLKDGRVVITWNSVDSASGYLVYRVSNPSDTNFRLISGAVVQPSFTDTEVINDSVYFYKVRSLLLNGDTSIFSSADDGRALNPGENYIANFSASAGISGRIDLSWNHRDSSSFTVMRKNFGDTAWTGMLSDSTDSTIRDTTASPGPVSYKLVVWKGTTRVGSYYCSGFRSVNDTEFFIEANKTIVHSQGKIGKMGALGSESDNGDSTGAVTYNSVFGSPVTVTIDYVDYRDFYLTLNGRQYTSITKVVSQDGTVSDAVIVSGIYSGQISYGLTVTGGKPSGGTYTVTQTGQTGTVISFDSVKQYVLQ